MKTIIRKAWTPKDLKANDLDLLSIACHLVEDSFLCFGSAWTKLRALELIDDDSKPTKLGRDLVVWYHALEN